MRVNRLSLSLLQLFRQPLPEVLKQRVMDPIGASSTWEWLPYRNAYVDIDGQKLPSVPGGAHWGGGIFISSEDHARLGLLIQRDGVWNGQHILPTGWVDFLREPSPCFPSYGGLWWVNRDRVQYPSAPATSFFAMGAGTNLIWIDQDLDLMMVTRWIDKASADDIIAGFINARNATRTVPLIDAVAQ